MILLLDTQAAVWWLAGSDRVSAGAREVLSAADVDDVRISVASVWELEIKRAKGKFTGPRLDELAPAAGIELLDIAAPHAVAAAALPAHHADPFDRMIVAQADVLGATLVSSDAALPQYGVPLIW